MPRPGGRPGYHVVNRLQLMMFGVIQADAHDHQDVIAQHIMQPMGVNKAPYLAQHCPSGQGFGQCAHC